MSEKWWREEIKRICSRKNLCRIFKAEKLEFDVKSIEEEAEEAQERLHDAIKDIEKNYQENINER